MSSLGSWAHGTERPVRWVRISRSVLCILSFLLVFPLTSTENAGATTPPATVHLVGPVYRYADGAALVARAAIPCTEGLPIATDVGASVYQNIGHGKVQQSFSAVSVGPCSGDTAIAVASFTSDAFPGAQSYHPWSTNPALVLLTSPAGNDSRSLTVQAGPPNTGPGAPTARRSGQSLLLTITLAGKCDQTTTALPNFEVAQVSTNGRAQVILVFPGCDVRTRHVVVVVPSSHAGWSLRPAFITVSCSTNCPPGWLWTGPVPVLPSGASQ